MLLYICHSRPNLVLIYLVTKNETAGQSLDSLQEHTPWQEQIIEPAFLDHEIHTPATHDVIEGIYLDPTISIALQTR